MTAAGSPALARRRVRLALRASREARGLTQSQVAEAMEWSLSKVMRIESGEVTVSATDLRALLAYLEVTDRATAESLLQDARVSRRRQLWWSDAEHREHLPPGLLKLIPFEAEATSVRNFDVTAIWGPLQTPTYAAAVLDAYRGDLSERAIEVRLDTRIRRQQELLSRRNPPQLQLLLDESVLHREVGGPEVMAQQLREVLRFVEKGRVMVRVVPFAVAAPIAMLGSFSILTLGDEDALLYRESHISDEASEDRDKISRYRDVYERLWSRAFDERASLSLVEQQAKSIASTARKKSRPG